MSNNYKIKILRALYTSSRLVLGVVFLYACWQKILDPLEFSKIIGYYQILPAALISPVALLLPWAELICGISLIVNRWTHGASLIIAILMLIFMVALGVNIYRGIDVSCGCFTLTQEAPSNMWHAMFRDGLLLIMAVWVLLYRSQNEYSQTTV